MKLSEHVNELRTLIERAFDKQFARLGIGSTKQIALEKLPSELHAKRQRFEEMLENHVGETGCYEKAHEKLLDELTFTLFNRIAAIKVMEAASLFPPIITKQPEHGDRSFGHKAWLEIQPDMRSEELEGIREYIKYAFDELGESLPLYNRSYPYALLPDVISLNEIIDAFNEVEKDPQVGADIWQSDDILGWLYESYNNVKKKAFKESNAKTEYDKVSLQSQVYTPRWVVQFLVDNSLGKLYLEMYPDSEIKRRYKIANAPKTQERKPKSLHEIRLIDPACGSGNFLLYAFDLFFEMYLDQIENYGADYNEDDIPRLIIENNLHGIDLDDRAVQLAHLGLYIKARKKHRAIGSLKLKVVSSDFFMPDYEDVRHIFEEGKKLDRNQKELIANIWKDLKYAYKFGSLIHIDETLQARLRLIASKQDKENPDLFIDDEIIQYKDFAATFFNNLKTVVEQYASTEGNTFLAGKTRDAITFLELLTTEYDVATANPPYTDSSDFGLELKAFIEANYKKPWKFHTNLYATFIKRCYEFTGDNGKIGMIHPHTFMFIKTFEDVRMFMIEKTHIDAIVDLGLDRVNLFGPGILLDATFYVLSKSNSKQDGVYFNLTTNLQEKYKKGKFLEALNDFVLGKENERFYTLSQSKLKIIKSWPFIYWISDEFREKFGEKCLDDLASATVGINSGGNERFLRFWWEVDKSDISQFYVKDRKKWVGYAKGGPFNKWYGNNWLRINWENDGFEVKHAPKSIMRNSGFYFREGVTYSASGSKGVSFRYLSNNNVFDVGGSSIFLKDESKVSLVYFLGYLNSKLCFYVTDCLNPTVNTQVGDLKRVPVIQNQNKHCSIVVELVSRNIKIKKHTNQFSVCELEFSQSPFVVLVDLKLNPFFNYENHLLTQILLNEAIINEKIFEVYELTEHDKAMVLAKEGESIGGLPVSAIARDAYLAEENAAREFSLDNIRDFIEALPVKDFSAEERESIESEFPSLYQSNNNLEEFCIRHQVNPINVWYWFKQNNVIPKQRMHTLAMEFLADMIREILMEDEDGVIPLVSGAGEKVLIDRIEMKFLDKEFSMAQYSSFDTVLGRPLDEYINKYFFVELSDHLNLFMYLPKTPFIWHLSSGPEQGFDCYIIIYKWNRDKMMRLRSVYIERRERALINRQSDLTGNESAEAQNEKDKIFRQLKEIESFKVKIDQLLSEGYNPILDDGVGKNIAPLQKKKMIPYEVLNAGQLEKYLNADW
ncbi:MAG: BREX-1 system adenine-specific DNA-methyltransferase PglX [Planctomycetes bacterium]|nr:BREX-1 system adenine-specific DNA-methyltransferase PglX [Planctomycetota bacterium]